MSTMRPTFETDIPLSREEAIRRFEAAVVESDWKSTSRCYGSYAELHVPNTDTRYWSPHLSLYFEGDDVRTKILGRFGPRQEIWTFVCLVYMALAFSAFFALMYCIALWTLGVFTWWCLVPPIAIGGIGLLYLASRIGQSWSMDQIQLLHAEYHQIFEQAFERSNRWA